MKDFKFGDKVQFVKLLDTHIEYNIRDGIDDDEEGIEAISSRDNQNIHLGDVGIIISVDSAFCDVLFDPSIQEARDSSYFYDSYNLSDDNLILNLNKSHIMPYSDESEQFVFEEMIRINSLPKLLNRKKYKTLDQAVVFDDDNLKVGCQSISKQDALQIAKDIQIRYGENYE